MQTICLFGSDYRNAGEIHSALKRMLDLPEYYGMNADALNDCLSERNEPVTLWIGDFGEGETEKALRLISRVIADNGGTVKEAE